MEVGRLLVKGILTEAHEAAGLTLEEEGDDFLFLTFGGIVIAHFSQQGATPEAVRLAADEWLDWVGDRQGVAGH